MMEGKEEEETSLKNGKWDEKSNRKCRKREIIGNDNRIKADKTR